MRNGDMFTGQFPKRTTRGQYPVLNQKEVDEILELYYDTDWYPTWIGRWYNVAPAVIRKIVNGDYVPNDHPYYVGIKKEK